MGVPKAGSILVVDDKPALREAIAHSLTRRGYHVTIAVDAVQGLERLQGAVFDVVITDLQGRERGGLWLWRKALEARPELTGRFVLITSEARPEAHDMTLFIDRERFLVKPFSLDTLSTQVEEIGHGGGPGEKRNRERGHEGIHLRRVLHEVREISIAGRFAPEAEAVRDAREERGSERDAGVEYRPSLHIEVVCAHGTLSLRGASWSHVK